MLLTRGQTRLLPWVNVHWAGVQRSQLQRLLPQYWACSSVYWNSAMRIERQHTTKSTGPKRQAKRDSTHKYTPYNKDNYRGTNRNIRSTRYNNDNSSSNHNNSSSSSSIRYNNSNHNSHYNSYSNYNNNEWRTPSRYQEEIREANTHIRFEKHSVAITRQPGRNDSRANVTNSSRKLPLQLRFYPNEGGLFESSITEDYLLRRATQITQRPLLVLDLNGTLIHRTKKTKQFYARPHLGEFLERVLKRYAVLIWSSARPENVRLMASHCFKEYETYRRKQQDSVTSSTSKTQQEVSRQVERVRYQDYLAALWDRRAFKFTREEYAGNPVTVKNLEFIWNWRTCWHARNTLIVDDSPEKVERQPKNWIYLSTFTNTQEQQNDSELLRLATYLEEIAHVKDIRSALDVNPFSKYVASINSGSGSNTNNTK